MFQNLGQEVHEVFEYWLSGPGQFWLLNHHHQLQFVITKTKMTVRGTMIRYEV